MLVVRVGIDCILSVHTELRVESAASWCVRLESECRLILVVWNDVLERAAPTAWWLELALLLVSLDRVWASSGYKTCVPSSLVIGCSQGIFRAINLWWALCHDWFRPFWFKPIHHLQLIVKWWLIDDLTHILVVVWDLMADQLVFLEVVIHLWVHLGVSQGALGSLVCVDLLFCQGQLIFDVEAVCL